MSGSFPVECVYTFPPDTPVELTALPSPPSIFQGWQQACAGTGPCLVTLNGGPGTPPVLVAGTFEIPNRPPTASAGGPYAGVRNQPITFDGTGSSDPDGDPLTYSWDFGDGATGTGPTPSHAYTSLGVFTVTLVVSDGVLSSPPAAAPVTISNQPPSANAGGPYSGTRTQPVLFSGAGSSDPDGDPLTYAWSFGDGAVGSGVAPSHAYTSLGTFTVSLVVNDGTGQLGAGHLDRHHHEPAAGGRPHVAAGRLGLPCARRRAAGRGRDRSRRQRGPASSSTPDR